MIQARTFFGIFHCQLSCAFRQHPKGPEKATLFPNKALPKLFPTSPSEFRFFFECLFAELGQNFKLIYLLQLSGPTRLSL